MNTAPLLGRINDADSHEMIPACLWEQEFGPEAAMIAPLFAAMPEDAPNTLSIVMTADDTPITAETVWQLKNSRAPGTIDPVRRLEMMDFVGIDRQLVFPSGPGLVGTFMAASTPELVAAQFGVDPGTIDLEATAKMLMTAHNDWAFRFAAADRRRLRVVATVFGATVADLVAETERAVDGGAGAITVPSSVPPAGLSPADTDLDPWYRVIAAARVPLVLHVGGEFGFMRSSAWSRAEAFRPLPAASIETPLDPYTLSTVHMGPQNFLTTLVLGGVFERHPDLRFGVIELGAGWFGSTGQIMDIWHGQFRKRLTSNLTMRPSEYLARNVRVTPFHHEPVDVYIDRYGMPEAYCFSTDFPHVEGGRAPIDSFAATLEHLGAGVAEQFFVTNAELLFGG